MTRIREPYVPPVAMTEHTLQDRVIRWAHERDWLVHAMHNSQDLWWGVNAGFPDLFMVRAERAIAAELKDARGRLRKPSQELWRDRFRLTSVEWYLWRPADEAEILRVLA